MMSENSHDHQWLKSFINEGIYIIPEGDNSHFSEKEEPATAPVKPVYSGKNRKNILVLVPGSPSEDERGLLENILKAAGLEPDDIALVNWQEHQRPDLPAILGSHVILSFGLDRDPWCDIEPYEIRAANGLTHLRAHGLAELQADKQRKRMLWNALRELFGI